MINKQALDCCFVCELVDRGGYQAYETLITKGTVCNLTRANEPLSESNTFTTGRIIDKPTFLESEIFFAPKVMWLNLSNRYSFVRRFFTDRIHCLGRSTIPLC